MFFNYLVFVISVLSFVHSAPNCGENEVYTNCMSPCKIQQCTHLKQMPNCDPNIIYKCQTGCECIQNFLRNRDNVCISSEICEEYDSQFDPETDIDVITNENYDDEATNEDQVFDNTVSSQDGLTKDTEEEVENTDQTTEDGNLDINGIEDYLSFEEELNNGDWVIEQTEHNDANPEPKIDQQKLDNKESEMDTEISTEKQTIQPAPENEVEPTTATTIAPNIKQSKISATELNKFSYEVITTEKSIVDLDLLSVTEKKLKPKEVESNITEPNQINLENKISNTKFDQNVEGTLETSTMPEKNELPIKSPVTEVYPEDNKDTNQRSEPPTPGHDNQPNKTRPEQNRPQPENNEWPKKKPNTEVYPEDREVTNRWPEPPRPWHGEQPYTTSRPEPSTKPWYPYIPPRKWHGSKHHKRPISQNSPITIIYPYPIFIEKSSERRTYPDTRPKYEHGYERKHERNHEHGYDSERGNERNRKHGYGRQRGHEHERNREHGYGRKHGHEHERNRKQGYDREGEHEHNREPERGYDREGGHEYERNRQPERRRENEYDRDREPERRRENEYDRDSEPERRRENEHERNREPERRRENEHEYGRDRPSNRRPRTWCRRHSGDKRRPCPRYRPRHDSHRDYKNDSNHYRSYKRPTRVCRNQRHGEPICYVRKDSRHN